MTIVNQILSSEIGGEYRGKRKTFTTRLFLEIQDAIYKARKIRQHIETFNEMSWDEDPVYEIWVVAGQIAFPVKVKAASLQAALNVCKSCLEDGCFVEKGYKIEEGSSGLDKKPQI